MCILLRLSVNTLFKTYMLTHYSQHILTYFVMCSFQYAVKKNILFWHIFNIYKTTFFSLFILLPSKINHLIARRFALRPYISTRLFIWQGSSTVLSCKECCSVHWYCCPSECYRCWWWCSKPCNQPLPVSSNDCLIVLPCKFADTYSDLLRDIPWLAERFSCLFYDTSCRNSQGIYYHSHSLSS